MMSTVPWWMGWPPTNLHLGGYLQTRLLGFSETHSLPHYSLNRRFHFDSNDRDCIQQSQISNTSVKGVREQK